MIEKYLSQKGLVQSVLTVEDLNRKVQTGGALNIMMGQTFDEGQPVDLLKYGLFIINFSEVLKGAGVKAIPRWLVADHFITEINRDKEVEEAQNQVQARVDYLERVNRTYRGNIGIVLSSQLSRSDEYQENLRILFAEGENNEAFQREVLKAVPEDRRTQPNAYRYPFEELATIQSMGTDIKIGPPYERHYDEPAREIASFIGFNRYVAIHLTKGFPFGNPTIPSNILEEIEAFGVLPYKKGSKGLGAYRIDPTVDSMDKVEELIGTSTDVRAVADLLVIAEQARQRIEGQIGFPLGRVEKMLEKTYNAATEKQRIKELQKLALELYVRYIHEPLQTK